MVMGNGSNEYFRTYLFTGAVLGKLWKSFLHALCVPASAFVRGPSPFEHQVAQVDKQIVETYISCRHHTCVIHI